MTPNVWSASRWSSVSPTQWTSVMPLLNTAAAFSASSSVAATFNAKGGQQQLRQSKFELELVEQLHLQKIISDTTTQPVEFHPSPRIATLKRKADRLRQKLALLDQEKQRHDQTLAEIQVALVSTNDIYQRTQLLDQLETLREWKYEPEKLEVQLQEVEFQLREQQAQDQLNHRERLVAAAEKAANREEPLRLSGIVTLVQIR